MHPYLIFSYFTFNVHDNDNEEGMLVTFVKNRHKGEGITSISISISSG